MKRTLLVLFLVLTVAACTNQMAPVEKIPSDDAKDSAETTETEMKSEESEEEPIKEFSYARPGKDRVERHLENCTSENPPRADHYKGGFDRLNLCGMKTEYEAVEFTEEGYLLYVQEWQGINSSTQEKELNVITTQEPFELTTIGTFVYDHSDTILVHGGEHDDIFVSYLYGEGMGSSATLFVFKPSTKEYVLAYHSAKMHGPEKMEMASSSHPESLLIYKRTKEGIDTDAMHLDSDTQMLLLSEIEDNDISIVYGDTTYTKAQVDAGEASDLEAMLSCQFPSLETYTNDTSDTSRYDHNIDLYKEVFPNKIPCFSNVFELDDLIGYLNFETEQFEPLAAQ